MDVSANDGTREEVVHVFVSYAREDRRWVDPEHRYNLVPFLAESLRRYKVAFWFDKELKPGDEFKRHIESQIDQSQIALLIVSQSFLNSEFIENREMPRIAERARQGKMVVVPVLVEPCDWSEYPFLADRQMVPSSPLIDYTDNDAKWAKIRFQILDGLKAQVKRIRETPRPAPAAEPEPAAIEPPQPAPQPMQEAQREPERFAAATTPEQGPQAAEPLTAELVAIAAGPPEVARVEAYVAADESFAEGLHAANQAREYAEAAVLTGNVAEPLAPLPAKDAIGPPETVAAASPAEELGKLHRVGRLLIAASLVACGVRLIPGPSFGYIPSLPFFPRNWMVIDSFLVASGAALLASALGIAIPRRAHAWALISGTVIILWWATLFAWGTDRAWRIWTLPAALRSVALVGAVLMVAGLERRRRTGRSRRFEAGRFLFAAAALACVLGGIVSSIGYRGYFWLDLVNVTDAYSRFFPYYVSSPFFGSMLWWTPLAFLLGPLAALGAAAIFIRRFARYGAMCLAAASTLFLPLLFFYRLDDFCGSGRIVLRLLIGWVLSLGVAGGALIVIAAIRKTQPERAAQGCWPAGISELFSRRPWVRRATLAAAVVLLAAIVLHGLMPLFFYEANIHGDRELGWLTARSYAAMYAPETRSAVETSAEIMNASNAGLSCAEGDPTGCSGFAKFYQRIGWNAGRVRRISAMEDAANFRALTAQCDGGNAGACAGLGQMYSEGHETAQNRAQAVALYQRACDGNSGWGCDLLADAYLDGDSVARSVDTAAKLAAKACKIDPSDCGQISDRLGDAYWYGNGVPRDYAKAGELYKRSCESGSWGGCNGLFYVAYAFNEGKGVARNYAKSAAFYTSSCNRGIAASCTNLGIQYEGGEGVPLNLSKAAVLYQKACDGGESVGCSNLGADYWLGDGVTQDKTKGLALLKKGCDMGNQWGCDRLKEFQSQK